MSIALTGLITGFAKGAKSRIEKEREENEALIQNRLKMAQTNRTLHQKQMDAQKQLLTGRLDTVSSYLPPDATEEQKLALISNEEISKQFVDLRSKGEEVDLNQFLVLNKDKVPQNFNTAQQYIDTLSAAPAPVPQQQVDAIRQTRGFLGARTGANVESMAQQFGMSAGQLLAYEEVSGVPRVPQFARMNVNMLRDEKTKDIGQRLKDAQSMLLDARDEFGPDSQEFKVAQSRYENLMTLKDVLEPKDVKWSDYVGSLKLAIVNARTPEERAVAKREYDQVIAVDRMGDKESGGIPTLPQLQTILTRSAGRAVQSEFGNMVGRDLILQKDINGEITGIQYVGTDAAARNRINDVAEDAMRYSFFRYLDMEGRPLNTNIETALRVQGIQFDQDNRAIFRGQGPRRETTTPAQKTRTRAQVQGVAIANNVPYETAAEGARSQGYTIID